MVSDGSHGGRIVSRLGGLREIAIAQSEDDRLRGDGVVRGALRAGLPAISANLAALIEEILDVSPRGVIRNQVELLPKPVEILLSFFVED